MKKKTVNVQAIIQAMDQHLEDVKKTEEAKKIEQIKKSKRFKQYPCIQALPYYKYIKEIIKPEYSVTAETEIYDVKDVPIKIITDIIEKNKLPFFELSYIKHVYRQILLEVHYWVILLHNGETYGIHYTGKDTYI